MVYLSYYEYYPIYEPAEGGYYYEGCRLVKSEKKSLRQAKKNLSKIWEETKQDFREWEVRKNYKKGTLDKNPGFKIYEISKYIGQGSFYCIERKKGSLEEGYRPYY